MKNIINHINTKISDKITSCLQKAASNKLVKRILVVSLLIYVVGFAFYMINSFSLYEELDKGIYELLFAILFVCSLWILAFMFKANKMKNKAIEENNLENKPEKSEDNEIN